ncbi:MAG: CinA family nicotinamide mononucleotide deamidase-related protein [Pirellulaceae bacterium]
MFAEIIAIGDELTSGQRLDTNSQWLSQRLGELGVRVLFHTTVADDLEADVAAFRLAGQRADLIVCTGGLGPTADDLTRNAIAAAADVELVLDEPTLEHIQGMFARRRGRPMPERNRVQAEFPRGARIIPNPHGTAPGIDLDIPRAGQKPSRVFALPGVPAEMREMWQASVEPAISQMLGGERRVIRHRMIKCFGVGESDLEQMLPDLIRRGRDPSVGITVHKATITLRVTAAGATPEECYAAMEPTIATIRDCLGVLAFGEEDDELQHAVVRLLSDRRQTVSVVEFGTGGLVSNWLSEADPEAATFLGGRVLRWKAFEHEEIARIAETCRHDHASDFAIALGPFPKLESAESDAESNKFHYAVSGPKGVVSKSALFTGHPDILKERSAKQALNLLRLTLLNGPE